MLRGKSLSVYDGLLIKKQLPPRGVPRDCQVEKLKGGYNKRDMKFNFKKIASVLSSAVMMSSTVALAAAANFPAPYVQGGSADVAVVYGSNAATTDLIASVDIQSSLADELARQTASSGGSVSGTISGGNAFPLFGSTKLYLNDTLNAQRNTVTDTDLPGVLADTTFSGDVDADLDHTIKIGGTPRIVYTKQPTSDDDPAFNIELSTTATKSTYNATVTFDKAVNFTNTDSEGEKIEMFGNTFTVGSATDSSDLVLFKASETLFLSSDVNPSQEVTVNGETYIAELAAASDTAATIKLTDSAGNSDQKEINEAASKKILGVEVGVNLADESSATNRITAEVVVGAEKVKLPSGSEVLIGTDEDSIDGTKVTFTGGTNAMTELTVQVAADDSDRDAIMVGDSFVDPVFGGFKISFVGLANDNNREDISVKNAGDDKMQLTMTDHNGNAKTLNWVYNATAINHQDGATAGIPILADSSGDMIHVVENAIVNKTHYTIIGNEDEASLIEVKTITNSSSGFSSDKVTVQDVFSGENKDVSITSEGTGTLSLGGNSYTVTYRDDSNSDGYIRINDPDSAGNGINLFNTIETSKGAKVAFYQPTKIDLGNIDGSNTDASSLRFPDGDGYTGVTLASHTESGARFWNVTFGSTTTSINTTAGGSAAGSIGQLTYNVTFDAGAGSNTTKVFLQEADGSPANINFPALVVFEEEDDNNVYEAIIVRLEGKGTDADGLGVTTADRTSFTSSGYGSSSFTTWESDTDISSAATLWGTVLKLDASESDQKSLEISYPADQIYAEVYVAEDAASITPGTSSGGAVVSLGNVLATDSEAGAISNKNLIVVGGSCINSVAAELLGGGFCSADFESNTGVGAGSFLIETFARSGGKVATLVAGYNAGDTTNAATYLTTQSVDTSVGKKYTGTSATSASLVTDTTSNTTA